MDIPQHPAALTDVQLTTLSHWSCKCRQQALKLAAWLDELIRDERIRRASLLTDSPIENPVPSIDFIGLSWSTIELAEAAAALTQVSMCLDRADALAKFVDDLCLFFVHLTLIRVQDDAEDDAKMALEMSRLLNRVEA